MRYSAGAVIETLVGFVIVIAAIVISIWAIVDAIRTPRDAFSAAGSSKALWLTLLLVFTVLAFFVTAVLGACTCSGSVRE
jgi:Ca2+/Na+ antiporter